MKSAGTLKVSKHFYQSKAKRNVPGPDVLLFRRKKYTYLVQMCVIVKTCTKTNQPTEWGGGGPVLHPKLSRPRIFQSHSLHSCGTVSLKCILLLGIVQHNIGAECLAVPFKHSSQLPANRLQGEVKLRGGGNVSLSIFTGSKGKGV